MAIRVLHILFKRSQDGTARVTVKPQHKKAIKISSLLQCIETSLYNGRTHLMTAPLNFGLNNSQENLYQRMGHISHLLSTVKPQYNEAGKIGTLRRYIEISPHRNLTFYVKYSCPPILSNTEGAVKNV